MTFKINIMQDILSNFYLRLCVIKNKHISSDLKKKY